jgi:hypothetical protein
MNHLNRATRELRTAYRSLEATTEGDPKGWRPEIIPFVVNLPAEDVPPWVRPEEFEAAVYEAVTKAVTRLAARSVTPGQLLARKNVPAELRSKAARAMLAMRGGRATAAKMRPLGYPNLVKARAVLTRKAARRRARHGCS